MAQLQIITPESIASLSGFGCLMCLSQSDLELVLLLVLAENQGFSPMTKDGLATLQEQAACFTCWSDTQKLAGIVLAAAETSQVDPQQAAEALSCLRCLPRGMVKAILTFLLIRESLFPIVL